MSQVRIPRRGFLGAASGLASVAIFGTRARAGERPPISNPRATDGDDLHEPDWQERLTITVGPEKADLVGRDDKPIQAALDYVARLGGGTVRVLPGLYTLRNAITLPSKTRLLGSGDDSILTKIASQTAPLAEDSDWYDQEITLQDAAGFQVGDGVVLQATNPHNGGQEVIKRTLVARSGNRFKLNDGIRKNLWLSGKPTASLLFPLLTSERTADVKIENVTLDGNRKNNENLNGNYGGCIFLQDCNRYTIQDVTTRNYNGDGISFQICHDVVVHHCRSHDNADLGIHPGSGSQRPRIRDNTIQRNGIGLFWCWGVKYGLAEGNRIEESTRFGVSIGHCDTDNVIRNNDITKSGQVGVLFRDDQRGKDFWANRNRLEGNRIVDSGGEEGIGIDITGKTKDLKLRENSLRETREPLRRTGIRIGANVRRLNLEANSIEGFAVDVKDLRETA